jgi:hypothetical protein
MASYLDAKRSITFALLPHLALILSPCNKIDGIGWLHSRAFGGEDSMWIFDSYFKGCVELWSREKGLERISAAYPPSFYMHLKDPHAHWEMIQALESRFRVEECSFNSIFRHF